MVHLHGRIPETLLDRVGVGVYLKVSNPRALRDPSVHARRLSLHDQLGVGVLSGSFSPKDIRCRLAFWCRREACSSGEAASALADGPRTRIVKAMETQRY